MSSYADKITTSHRFAKVRRLRTGLLAFQGVLVVALMAYLINADGPRLNPVYVPTERALFLLLIMVLVVTIENCLFRALEIRYAYKDAHRFLIADSGMKGSLRTVVLACLVAVLLLLPQAQDASRVLLSKSGSETVGPIQTRILQFSNTDFLGVTHSRSLTIRVDSGSLRVTISRNGAPFNPGGTIIRLGTSLTWDLPVGGYALYNATLENTDSGLSAFFTFDVKVGLPDNFATFLSYVSILLAAINGAWYAYLRPIRRRHATTSIYSADYQGQSAPEDAWLVPRRPEERPWYELQPQYGPATAPWPVPSARRHVARGEGKGPQTLLEIPPPPTDDAPEPLLSPPPPPPGWEPPREKEVVIYVDTPRVSPAAPPAAGPLQTLTPVRSAAPALPVTAARSDEAPDTAESLVERGEERLVGGDASGALELFNEALAKDRNNIAALLKKADILRATGKQEEAIDALQRVLFQDSRHHRALLLKAQILESQERLEEALECYDRVAKGKPEYVEALRSKAEILVKLGEVDMAVACLQEASRLVPGDETVVARLKELQSALEPPKPPAKAEAPPPSAATPLDEKKSVQELQGKGIGYMHVGMYNDALASFEAILAKEPKNGFALLSKARVLERLGRREEALAAYRAALELDPRDLNALAALGDLLLRMGREGDAMNYFQQAAAVDPRGGSPEDRMKKYREARARLEEFLVRLTKEQGVPEGITKAVSDGYASLRTLEAATIQELMSVKGMEVATARRILDEAKRLGRA